MKYIIIIILVLILILTPIISYIITMVRNKIKPIAFPTDGKCISNSSCVSTQPYCDYSTGTCVECVTSNNCDGSFCTDNKCEGVPCVTDADCADQFFTA